MVRVEETVAVSVTVMVSVRSTTGRAEEKRASNDCVGVTVTVIVVVTVTVIVTVTVVMLMRSSGGGVWSSGSTERSTSKDSETPDASEGLLWDASTYEGVGYNIAGVNCVGGVSAEKADESISVGSTDDATKLVRRDADGMAGVVVDVVTKPIDGEFDARGCRLFDTSTGRDGRSEFNSVAIDVFTAALKSDADLAACS